jgi:hypothetical protein
VSRDARLTFIELWPQCDDAGRIRANSRMLASILFPYDEDAPKLIDGWLSELEKEDCIVRYQHEKDEYIAICHWDHQKIDHPQPSKLPPPPAKKRAKTKLSSREQQAKDREPSPKVRAVSSTVSGPIPDRIGEYQLSLAALGDAAATDPSPKPNRSKPKTDPRGFSAFYDAFPRKVGRGDALKAFEKALKIATPEQLHAGALRYAAARENEDPTYTKHPATWLNKQCWLDEESTNGTTRNGFNGNGTSNLIEGTRRAIDRAQREAESASGSDRHRAADSGIP